ncbi:ABC transporter substrate-binding protein [Fictibacillus enclensis]|uniref:ABC transporter substrate-binding protein n=1 Tax=Fictibacillus enclensis TaxID=1017270 RepID=UPI0025A2430B|nr:ABC transporter substrate-binding protein [Fictibacillus enclensis]MDM5339064.1 ABC transporter substrate-binding protein [Fictibacillus enclensis]
MKKRCLTLLSIFMVVGVLLSGCSGSDSAGGNNSGDKVNIRFSWWTNPNRTKVTKEAIKLFEKKYPNIHVTMEYYSWDAYWQKMATVAAGGKLPDVMQMDGSRLRSFAEKGQVMDLSKQDIDTSGLNKNTVNLGKLDGKLYALTTSINAQFMISNPEILKKAGVSMPDKNYTWEEFADILVKINKKTGKYGAANEMEQPAYLDYFARTKGESLYSSDGKSVGVSKTTLKEWFQFWLDLQEKGGVPSAQVNSSYSHNEMTANPFLSEKTAFNWLFLGTDGQYEKSIGKPIGRELLPEWGNDNKPYPLHAAMFWTMSSKTEHPDAAAKLMNFLENDTEVAKLFQNDRGIPANTKNMQLVADTSSDGAVKKQNEFMKKVQKIATPLQLDPASAGSTGDILKNIAQQVTFKKLTPSKAADQFISEMNTALNK